MTHWKFQFLIGRLTTVDLQSLLSERQLFQFLIGRLTTKKAILTMGLPGAGFQFLIGRLTTDSIIRYYQKTNRFQFLIGRLTTLLKKFFNFIL